MSTKSTGRMQWNCRPRLLVAMSEKFNMELMNAAIQNTSSPRSFLEKYDLFHLELPNYKNILLGHECVTVLRIN